MEEENEYDVEFEAEFSLLDNETTDAVDFFSTQLMRQFPDLNMTEYTSEAREWRSGWEIEVPAQAAYSVQQVTAAAIKLQDKFYWAKSILIPFTVAREEEETTNETVEGD